MIAILISEMKSSVLKIISFLFCRHDHNLRLYFKSKFQRSIIFVILSISKQTFCNISEQVYRSYLHFIEYCVKLKKKNIIQIFSQWSSGVVKNRFYCIFRGNFKLSTAPDNTSNVNLIRYLIQNAHMVMNEINQCRKYLKNLKIGVLNRKRPPPPQNDVLFIRELIHTCNTLFVRRCHFGHYTTEYRYGSHPKATNCSRCKDKNVLNAENRHVLLCT